MVKTIPQNSTPLSRNITRSARNFIHVVVISTRFVVVFLPIFALGCASPGPPRSPSLNQPEPIKTAEIQRIGQKVDIEFHIPQRNTDHLPLTGKKVTVTLCKSIDSGKCTILPGTHDYAIQTAGQPTKVLITDDLGSLAQGSPHLLSYRIDLKDIAGHTAGYSEPFFTASGGAPGVISRISVDGSRLGVVISWGSVVDHGEVVIRRDTLPQKPKSEPVFLAFPADAEGSQLLDTSAVPETAYRYTAEIRRDLEIGGRKFVVHSEPSESVTYVLHEVYPPPVPTDLSAAVFPLKNDAAVGVDLIWQPVQDARLKGYIVYRMGADGVRVRVAKEPVGVPAFHDEVGLRQGRVTYSVSAIDVKGNESGVVSTTVDVAAQ
jgi:hypothetical protein